MVSKLIFHHSEILAKLQEEGSLPYLSEVETEKDGTITFHDPCYLGKLVALSMSHEALVELIKSQKGMEGFILLWGRWCTNMDGRRT